MLRMTSDGLASHPRGEGMVSYGTPSFSLLWKQEKTCSDGMGVSAHKYTLPFLLSVIVQDFMSFLCQIIAVSPHLCPMSMAATLVSIGNDEGDNADRLRKACVATLCELGK